MKKVLLMLLVAVVTLSGCGKDDGPDLDKKSEKLVEVKSYYQTYSFGSLNPTKKDWNRFVWDDQGRIISEKEHVSYEYDGILNLPRVLSYTYNDDGTIKTTSDRNYVYKHFYNDRKQLVKKESWRESGIRSVTIYEYENNLLRLIRSEDGSVATRYNYDNSGRLAFEEYKLYSDDSFRINYSYEYNSKGDLTKKNYHNSKGEVRPEEQYEYVYNNRGYIETKLQQKGFYGKKYKITYTYNDEGQIKVEKVELKRENSDQYDGWMYITYEYIFK